MRGLLAVLAVLLLWGLATNLNGPSTRIESAVKGSKTLDSLVTEAKGNLGISGDGEAKTSGCQRPKVAVIRFSRSKYPNIVSHIESSWAQGYAKVRRINRIGTSTRRDKLLEGIPTRPGYDRDEAPAAVLRSTVKASVRYVPSSENRSAGSSLGHQIGKLCDGVRVRYTFTP